MSLYERGARRVTGWRRVPRSAGRDEKDLDFPDGVFDGTSDGTCDTSSTSGMQCTLRAAIQEANENDNAPAVDTINFNITSGTTSVKTINVVNENRPGNV